MLTKYVCSKGDDPYLYNMFGDIASGDCRIAEVLDCEVVDLIRVKIVSVRCELLPFPVLEEF